MTPRWLLSLDQLATEDATAEVIGGKAFSLLQMSRAGLPVPAAWVLPIAVCEDYFAHDRTLPRGVMGEVESLIESLPQLVRFAVRSGAAASMPGMLQSVLNCATSEELERGIRTVLDSWQSPSAVVYRRSRHLTHLKGTAVLIQVMVATDVAGVMFTRDPRSPEADRLIIEAVRGLGEQLVSGTEAGQRWDLSRAPAKEERPSVAGELLSPDQLSALAAYGLRVEAIFGQSVDVEWGLADGRWSLFQARPILFQKFPVDESSRWLNQENARLAEFRQRGDTLWVRHNLCETLPHPTPLTWSIMRRFMNGAGGYGQLYRRLGFSPSRQFNREGFLELIAGQIYASANRLPDLYGEDYPFGFDRQELLRDPSAIDRAPAKLDLDRVGPWFLLRSPWIAWTLWRAGRRIKRLQSTALRTLNEETIPRYREWLESERQQPLESLSVIELAAILQRRVAGVFDRFAPELMLTGVLGAASLEMLRQQAAFESSPEAADELCQRLLRTLRVPVLDELHGAMIALHAGQLSRDEFVAQYGHRSAHEMELAEPRWSEVPDQIPVVSAIFPKSLRRRDDDGGGFEREPTLPERFFSHASIGGLGGRRTGDFREIADNLSFGAISHTLRSLFETASSLLPMREVGKHEIMRGSALIRQVCVALEQATGMGGDLYFLSVEQLSTATSTDEAILRKIARRRRREWAAHQTLPHPVLIDERGLIDPSNSSPATTDELVGSPISPGIAAGPAWFPERHPGETPPCGSVIVASMLPPHFVAFMAEAKAIIVDQTALLSHGAILARQFGIPVVSHPLATATIREGGMIRVDANIGRISTLESIPNRPSDDEPLIGREKK